MGWVEFVQVRLRTNLVPSLALGDRSRAADRVWFTKLRHPPSTGSECFLLQLHFVFLMLLCFLWKDTRFWRLLNIVCFSFAFLEWAYCLQRDFGGCGGEVWHFG